MFQGWGGLIPNKLTKAPDCRETAKDDFGVSEAGPRKRLGQEELGTETNKRRSQEQKSQVHFSKPLCENNVSGFFRTEKLEEL